MPVPADKRSVTVKKGRLSYERKKSLSGYVFLAPWLLGLFGLFFRTFVTSIIYSFSDLQLTTDGVVLSPAGFARYDTAFYGDPKFIPLLTSQLQDMLLTVPVILMFSLFIAVLLNQEFRGRALARSIFFLPVVIGSGVVISIIQGDQMSNEVINGTRAAGLFESSSIFDTLEESGLNSELVGTMMGIVNDIFELSWHSGLQIILFLAALQTVPDQLYEVAKVEGATSWEVFFKITLPMITPIMLVNLIYTIVDNFTDYGNSLMIYILDLGRKLNFSYSAALGNIYFIIIFAVILLVLLIVGRKVTYVEK